MTYSKWTTLAALALLPFAASVNAAPTAQVTVNTNGVILWPPGLFSANSNELNRSVNFATTSNALYNLIISVGGPSNGISQSAADARYLARTADNGGSLTNLQGSNIVGTVSAATNATYATYATNAQSATVAAIATIAQNITPGATLNGANANALSNLNASALGTGTIPDARLSANVTLLGPTIDVGGAEITGTLKAGSFPALTGDVTTSAGSLATTIANDAVSNAKLANMAQDRIKGRVSSGTGDPEDLTAWQVKGMLAITGDDVSGGTLGVDSAVVSSNLIVGRNLDVTNGNVTVSGNVTASGSFNGAHSGDGGGLTNLNASSLSSGTIPDARISNNIVRANDLEAFQPASGILSNLASDGILPFIEPGTGVTFNTNGNVLTINSTGGGGTGSVTSVGLQMPAQFSVSSTPITGSGTLGVSWQNQSANRVLAGPTSGGLGQPTFRALVEADIPQLSYVAKTGDTMTGPLTNNFGYHGDGGGLTNLQVNAENLTGTIPDARMPSAIARRTNDTLVSPVIAGGTNNSVANTEERIFNVRAFGAAADARVVTRASITTGSTTLTSPNGNWTLADIGKGISVYGAGSNGWNLTTTIAGVNSATSITLSDAAATSVSEYSAVYGTDDTAALQAAFNALTNEPVRSLTLVFPGMCYVSGPLVGTNNAQLSVPPYSMLPQVRPTLKLKGAWRTRSSINVSSLRKDIAAGGCGIWSVLPRGSNGGINNGPGAVIAGQNPYNGYTVTAGVGHPVTTHFNNVSLFLEDMQIYTAWNADIAALDARGFSGFHMVRSDIVAGYHNPVLFPMNADNNPDYTGTNGFAVRLPSFFNDNDVYLQNCKISGFRTAIDTAENTVAHDLDIFGAETAITSLNGCAGITQWRGLSVQECSNVFVGAITVWPIEADGILVNNTELDWKNNFHAIWDPAHAMYGTITLQQRAGPHEKSIIPGDWARHRLLVKQILVDGSTIQSGRFAIVDGQYEAGLLLGADFAQDRSITANTRKHISIGVPAYSSDGSPWADPPANLLAFDTLSSDTYLSIGGDALDAYPGATIIRFLTATNTTDRPQIRWVMTANGLYGSGVLTSTNTPPSAEANQIVMGRTDDFTRASLRIYTSPNGPSWLIQKEKDSAVGQYAGALVFHLNSDKMWLGTNGLLNVPAGFHSGIDINNPGAAKLPYGATASHIVLTNGSEETAVLLTNSAPGTLQVRTNLNVLGTATAVDVTATTVTADEGYFGNLAVDTATVGFLSINGGATSGDMLLSGAARLVLSNNAAIYGGDLRSSEGEGPSLSLSARQAYDSGGTYTIDWDNAQLRKLPAGVTLDWGQRRGYGTWTFDGLNGPLDAGNLTGIIWDGRIPGNIVRTNENDAVWLLNDSNHIRGVFTAIAGTNGVVTLRRANGTFANFFANPQQLGYPGPGPADMARGAALLAALNAAGSGDVIHLGPGVFDLAGATNATLGTNVSLIGQGRGQTIIVNVTESDCSLKLTRNNTISSVTLSNSTAAGNYVGVRNITSDYGRLVFDDVAIYGYSGMRLPGTGSVEMRHSYVYGSSDSLSFTGDNLTIALYDSVFECVGTGRSLGIGGGYTTNSTAIIKDCVFKKSGEASSAFLFVALSTSRASLFNCTWEVDDGSLHVQNTGGTLTLDAACNFDAEKVSGPFVRAKSYGHSPSEGFLQLMRDGVLDAENLTGSISAFDNTVNVNATMNVTNLNVLGTATAVDVTATTVTADEVYAGNLLTAAAGIQTAGITSSAPARIERDLSIGGLGNVRLEGNAEIYANQLRPQEGDAHALSLNARQAYDSGGTYTIDWDNAQLRKLPAGVTLDWGQRRGYGTWTFDGLNGPLDAGNLTGIIWDGRIPGNIVRTNENDAVWLLNDSNHIRGVFTAIAGTNGVVTLRRANGTFTNFFASPLWLSTDMARGAALLAALNAAGSGDVVHLGPGVFDLAGGDATLGTNVSLIGQGRGQTIIVNVTESDSALKLTRDNTISSVTISNSTAAGNYVGVRNITSDYGRMVFDDVAIYGYSDGMTLLGTGSVEMRHSYVYGSSDSLSFAGPNLTIALYDSVFECVGPGRSLGIGGESGGLGWKTTANSTAIIKDCVFKKSGEASSAFFFGAQSTSRASLFNCTWEVDDGSLHVLNMGGTLTLDAACNFDAEKVSGAFVRAKSYGHSPSEGFLQLMRDGVLDAENLTGTIPDARLSTNVLLATNSLTLPGDLNVTGNIKSGSINGAGLTNASLSALNEWPFVPLFFGGSGGSFGPDTFGRSAAVWNATANATWNSYAPAEMWSATGKSNVVLRVYVSTGTNGTYNFNLGVSWWTATNTGYVEKAVPITVDDTKQVTLVTATNTIPVPPEQVLGVRASIYTSNPGSVVGLVGGTVIAQ